MRRSHTVVIEDVFVPEAAVSLQRPADVWHPIFDTVVTAAMPLVMSAYNGVADRAAELATELAGGTPQDHRLQLLGEMSNAHLAGSDAVNAMLASSENLAFEPTNELSSRTLSRKTTAAESFIAS